MFTNAVTSRRWAWLFVVVPLLFAGVVLGAVGEPERDLGPSYLLPDDSGSAAAAELAERLPQETTEAAIVLWTADSGTLDGAALKAIRAQMDGEVQASDDGTAALTVIPITAGDADKVGEQVDELRKQLRADAPDGSSVVVTGPAGIHADLGKVFDGADLRLLLATIAIVAILLVVTYRSPVLWLVPLIVVGVADRLAVVVGSRALDAVDLPFDGTTGGILSVLVFGAGTDYALLLISRYRDELRAEDSRHVAMARALRPTAEAVLGSSLTVFLAVLALLLSLTPGTRGIGLACAIGIVIAAFFALVVLPAALVLFGRWIFWPMVPRKGDPQSAETASFFSKVGRLVARRPVWLVGGTLALLAILASGLTGLRFGLDEADQLLDRPESISAADRLADSFPAGSSEPAQVVTTDEAAKVHTLIDQAGVGRATEVASGEGITEFSVTLSADPGSAAARDSIVQLRDALSAVDDTHVGGAEAEALDMRNGAERDLKLIVPLILLLVLLGLGVLLRSVLGPLVLVASVVGTYVAALGASWWIFTAVFDFPAIASQVPLLAFLFLVALGVDYNIFLITRAREEGRSHGSREGMLRALTVTGGVITSAGILLAAVFAVLGVLPLVALAQLGTIICIGVLLDALIVRTVFVPAIGVLLGDRFWWPRQLARATQES